MATQLFIDGAVGTTGLEIRERLSGRKEFDLVMLSEAERKDAASRARALNSAEIVILCLPDDAAREAVALIENPDVRVIDASTAHRVAEGWVYGFPELEPGQREAIRAARRVSNPGCYAQAFVALARPLVRAGVVPFDWPVSCHAASGYSGGGRAMIAEFEDEKADNFTRTVYRSYGLGLAHKHVEEMRAHAGLRHQPVFAPSVARVYRGMILEIPLALWALPGRPSLADLHRAYTEAYAGETVVELTAPEAAAAKATLDLEEMKGTDRMRIYVFGNEKHTQARVVATLDNLGKGAAGAAVQNLNVMMGWPETLGLVLAPLRK